MYMTRSYNFLNIFLVDRPDHFTDHLSELRFTIIYIGGHLEFTDYVTCVFMVELFEKEFPLIKPPLR